MKIVQRCTEKRKVRQRRQLRWRREVHMPKLNLETKEGEKLYRLARQRDRAGKDVQHVRFMKDENGNYDGKFGGIVKETKEIFEKLINEEMTESLGQRK